MSELPAVQTRNLSKSFGGIRALSNVSCTIQPGEIVGMIGPNGSGKTTLINVLSGLLKADAGTIQLFGENVTNQNATARAYRGISRTFQVAHRLGDLTGGEFVELGIRFGSKVEARRPTIDRLIEQVGLPLSSRNARATSLSVGQQRRLDIARALGARPRLLLLDEPFAGLGATETRIVTDIIREAARTRDVAVMIVEHKLRHLFELCPRILALARGELIAAGAPTEVMKDPVVLKEYLG